MKSQRNQLRIAIAAALFLSLLNLTPASAITPGEGCQKVGQISIIGEIKYFCVLHKKSDGRTSAIWNKGVAFPESPAKKLTVRYIAFTALKSYFEKQPIRTDKVDSHIDPALDPTIRDLFLTYAEDAFRFWGKDYLPDATMFIGAATPWYVKEQCDYALNLNVIRLPDDQCMKRAPIDIAAGSGWPNQDPQQLNANGAVFAPWTSVTNSKIMYAPPLYIYLSSLESKLRLNISAVAQHELTHLAQWNAYGTGSTSNARVSVYEANRQSNNINFTLLMRPEIWTEGSAYYFGNSLGEMRAPGRLEKDMSAETGKRLSTRSKSLDFLTTEPYPYIGPNMTPEQDEAKNDFYQRRYWVGGLMTELMCAHFGMEKCMSFNRTWADGATDKNATLKSVFEKHFAMPWATWTKVTDAYVSDILNSKPTPLTKYFS